MQKESICETAIVRENNVPRVAEEAPREDGSRDSIDKEEGLANCRVCQCIEPDRKGNIALGFLGVSPPLCSFVSENEEANPDMKVKLKTAENEAVDTSDLKGSQLVEFISPTGEVFVCTADIESGLEDDGHDRLIVLGCACKSDLALAHYACALKWFINHGSTVCEICGSVAKNIRPADLKKVLGSLKEYEALRERVVNGEPNPAQPQQTDVGVDPDAVAAIRRQRLSEISLWFNPHNNTSISHVVSERPLASNTIVEEVAPIDNTATRWAVECTGILLATGLLTVTLAWFIAPHVGKRTAKNGLHVLLGGVCALTVVIFFRFFVLTRIKYGPARYWAILFVFWFLVFGIWASRTHGVHTT